MEEREEIGLIFTTMLKEQPKKSYITTGTQISEKHKELKSLEIFSFKDFKPLQKPESYPHSTLVRERSSLAEMRGETGKKVKTNLICDGLLLAPQSGTLISTAKRCS